MRDTPSLARQRPTPNRVRVITAKELKALIPEGHEIVMMLDAKDGCRVFTSSKRDADDWEYEVLIPAELLADPAGCELEFAPTRPRPSRAA